tara:strand:- start:107 stop:343 length:237 start_codon:yes stop_codon:yes gene_type:complete
VNFHFLLSLLLVKILHHQILHHQRFYMKGNLEYLKNLLLHHLQLIVLQNLKHYQYHLVVVLFQDEFLLLQLQLDKPEQ